MRVHIIGGGVIGLCTAYYLHKKEIDVTIVDSSELEDGCSYGNAGMLTPSHFIPLSAPGVIRKGVKWMLNPSSPLYIKPAWNASLYSWLWKFYKHANWKHANSSMDVLKTMNLRSRDLYKQLSTDKEFMIFANDSSGFGFRHQGLAMVYRTNKGEQEELRTADLAEELGLEIDRLDTHGIRDLYHGIPMDVLGAVIYKDDAQIIPNDFMEQMKKYLLASGVQFELNTKVKELVIGGNMIKEIRTSRGNITAKHVVLCAGAFSGKLLQNIGMHLPMQGGKGYSYTLSGISQGPVLPTILSEAKVAMTPMRSDLRIGGTMEINQFREGINHRRVKAIGEAVGKYFPSLKNEPVAGKFWYGFRPCSPDGIPYMGRSDKYSNLFINTGHAMMGMSLAPFSGKYIADKVAGTKPKFDSALLKPDRFQ